MNELEDDLSLSDVMRRCDPHETDEVIKTLNAGANEIERIHVILRTAQRDLLAIADQIDRGRVEPAHWASSVRTIAASLPV